MLAFRGYKESCYFDNYFIHCAYYSNGGMSRLDLISRKSLGICNCQMNQLSKWYKYANTFVNLSHRIHPNVHGFSKRAINCGAPVDLISDITTNVWGLSEIR